MSKENRKEKPSKLTDDKLETVINPEDRKIKKIDTDHISIKNEKYEIMKDYKEALDLELLEERYSDFLEKYDYIVGDMSYGKLRLRGFYNDDVKKIPIDMRISYLEDYLLEYCSFGCAYFVLKNRSQRKRDLSISIVPIRKNRLKINPREVATKSRIKRSKLKHQKNQIKKKKHHLILKQSVHSPKNIAVKQKIKMRKKRISKK